MELGKVIRPVRNRRHSRKLWPPGEECHTVKRLFTPEIKRMLKDWLVRRRENPYPSRDEKRRLAYETGLTYTQICNWFANWRRKLKNNDGKNYKNSWCHLINTCNTNGHDAFLLDGEDNYRDDSPTDSLWDESDEGGSNISDGNSINGAPGYYTEQSPRTDDKTAENKQQPSNPKYKQKIMEKYLRDTSDIDLQSVPHTSSPELSKWLQSAEKFTPEKCNYYIEWDLQNRKRPTKTGHVYETIHEKEELDAAEALANLAFNSRQRMLIQTGGGDGRFS